MSSSSDSIRARTSGWGTVAGFSEQGFAVVEGVIAEVELADLRAEAGRLLAESARGVGARGGLGRSRAFAELAGWPPLRGLAEECLGSACHAVMLTVFDKSAQANWKVPWHQDLTIAVRERVDVPGFGPWSVKDGVTHVQPLRSKCVRGWWLCDFTSMRLPPATGLFESFPRATVVADSRTLESRISWAALPQ